MRKNAPLKNNQGHKLGSQTRHFTPGGDLDKKYCCNLIEYEFPAPTSSGRVKKRVIREDPLALLGYHFLWPTDLS